LASAIVVGQRVEAMSAELDTQSITGILSGFTSAECVAEDVVDLILSEGGKHLYQSYIDRKSFSFGADSIATLLVAELNMCFVRHDAGEPVKQVENTDRSATSPGPMALAVPSGPVDYSDVDPAASPESRPLPPPLDMPEGERVEDAVCDPVAASGPADSSEPVSQECAASPEVSCFSWALEAEPVPCRIDTWARACVPVRRTLVRPKMKPMDPKASKAPASVRGKKLSTMSKTSHDKMTPQQTPRAEDDKTKVVKDGMIPLVEHVEHDEEEAAMREMKEREAKRKREEENRIHRKVTQEAEEAARLVQVKDQMKDKPYTYDSAGNIIWVTPMNAEKLPSAIAIPTFTTRREMHSAEDGVPHRKNSKSEEQKKTKELRDLAKKGKGGKANKDMEFVDGFKKLCSAQPPMLDTMKMSPGVNLRERGQMKNGGDIMAGNSSTAMTRRDYEALVQSGRSAGAAKEKDQVKESEAKPVPEGAALGAGRTSPQAPVDAADAAAAKDSGTPRAAGTHAGVKAVHPTGPSSGLVPHAPAMPRPDQPIPPPGYRRVQMKQAAIGYFNHSTRERMPTSTVEGSRFPGCAAPPVLGAVMGHGLIPLGSKHEEFYFPNSAGLPLGIPDEDAANWPTSPQGSSAVASPRAEHGNIVSKNPELAKRLFNR